MSRDMFAALLPAGAAPRATPSTVGPSCLSGGVTGLEDGLFTDASCLNVLCSTTWPVRALLFNRRRVFI